jgi:hypothetical protein
MSSKQNATIAPSANGGFAVIAANGELLHDGFKSRGHAAMWTARKGSRARGGQRGGPLIPRPVQNNGVGSRRCEGDFHDRASDIAALRAAIEMEIFGGRKWREVISADGVRTEVARLSRKAAP